MRNTIKGITLISWIVFFSTLLPLLIPAYSQTPYTQPALITPEYIGIIQQKVSSSFFYPPEARENGWEGIVKVRFVLTEGGQIKDIGIAESSGYPLLDSAAISAIKDASPYPFPKDYKGDLEIVLPINYRRPPDQTASASEPPAPENPRRTKSFAWLREIQKSLTADYSQEPEIDFQPGVLTPEYLGFIQQKIGSRFLYPPEARENGWEGIVKVRFVLTEGGQIKDIGIAESSGYPLLDSAAISAIKDASPYPFPKDYKGDLEIVLPINYQQPRSYLRRPLASRSLAKHDYTQKAVAQPQEAAPTGEKTSLLSPERTPDLTLAPASIVTPMLPPEPTPGQLTAVAEELPSFIEVALKNNQPTQVAREEVELAQIKIAEAKRNFLPGMKVWGYTTDGEVNKVDYEEKEARLELSQPLFYGGRLGDTYNQARVNMEITRRNYERLKFDVMHKAETAYYNLVAAKMHLESKEAVRKEARETLAKIEKLAAAGMIIPLEASSARSWYDQIEFQVDNIKQDLFMAELTFKQILNINYVPLIEGAIIETKPFDFDLDQLSNIARKYRPEVAVSKLLVTFQEYGQKIETKKKNSLSVDLVGSYGKYSGHYVTEPWQDSSNWYAGIKATKPIGASTLNSSYTTEDIQPRFGQTSPTSSTTLNGELNVMDNLKRLSDKKRADIDLHRALSDYNETIKTVNFEVQDALLNYQKALLQLNTAEAEMKFRRNETEITKTRSMVADASLANTMESLYQFSEAQSRYMRALANYRLSLTNLKKSCGYGIEI